VNRGVRKLAIHLEDFKSGQIHVVFTPAGASLPTNVKLTDQ
jgi:hypothetical protein